MRFSEEVKAALWELIDEMSLNVSEFTVHPEKDFTRKKKWDFPTLMKFTISMESQSLKMNFTNILVILQIVQAQHHLTKEELRFVLRHFNLFLHHLQPSIVKIKIFLKVIDL